MTFAQSIRVSEIMTRKIVTVGPDDDLLLVRALFDDHRFHHLLVTEGRRLVGIVSDRDLLRAISPFIGRLSERSLDLATLNRRVHQVMSRHVITITADALALDAASLMLNQGVSCVPVVRFDSVPVGILTSHDLLRIAIGHPTA